MSEAESRLFKAGVLAVCAMASGAACASGFALIENSAQGMGNAFAGGGAVAEDGSAAWFNPAAMTRLPDSMYVGGHVIDTSFKFDGTGSAATGAPILGQSSTDGGKTGVVPNLYYVRRLNDDIYIGLAVNVPFGLSTEYDRDWVGRYQAVESKITTLNVNPSMAWKLTDRISLGAGVSFQYMRAKLSSALDFRSACLGAARSSAAAAAAATDPATAARLAAEAAALNGSCAGPQNTDLDGFAENKADSVSFGFNAGALFELSENTRFSAAYRSSVNHNLDGDATYALPSNPAVQAVFGSLFPKDGITADVELPSTVSISAYHRFMHKFAVMADATWTEWSKIENLTIVSDDAVPGRNQASVEELNWKDTWRLSLGFSYYHDDRLTLRTGFAYDEAPVTGSEFLTARLPDADRYWVSVGASYRFTDRIQADLGYSHLFVDDPGINRVGNQGDNLVGSYDASADIFSFQLNYEFD